MTDRYFNHTLQVAENRWQRRTFANMWWQLGAQDKRWIPPYAPHWHWAIDAQRNPHLARLNSAFLFLDGLPRGKPPRRGDLASARHSLYEVPLTAVALLHNPAQKSGTGWLAGYHAVNDRGSLGIVLEKLQRLAWEFGITRILGPTGLSPHLNMGLLTDYWNVTPPLHTPYQPPYMAEMVSKYWRVLANGRLYHLPVTSPKVADLPIKLSPFDPYRLTDDLYHLVQSANFNPFFPAPDPLETAYLIRTLMVYPTHTVLAKLEGEPVGFALWQPDLAPLLHRWQGGRSWWRWPFLKWRLDKARAWNGRLLALTVLPAYRGQGIGAQLLAQVRLHAQRQRWENLIIGPLWQQPHPLIRKAIPKQSYNLYEINV